jgi:hypothetical protein
MNKHFSRISALSATIALVLSSGAFAADLVTSTQDVNWGVNAIDLIDVDTTGVTLTITTTTDGKGGSLLKPVSNLPNSANWNVTTNGLARKITAAIDDDMPTGVTLTVALDDGTVGDPTSGGPVALSEVAAEVYAGLEKTVESGHDITYELSALVSAGVLTSQTKRVVTYTLTGTL